MKTCCECKIEKNSGSFYNRGDGYGERHVCKECYKLRNQKRRIPLENISCKRCSFLFLGHKTTKYCETCRNIKIYPKKGKVDIICDVCLKDFSGTANQKYCSKSCARTGHIIKGNISKKNRVKNNPALKLHINISRMIRKSFNKEGVSILKYLPYTSSEIREHLESLWEDWMSWDNYGKLENSRRTWNIDHKIPQSLLPYDSYQHPNFLKCWELSNLRPMAADENTKKGNKI